MLFHIRPRLYSSYKEISLVDLKISAPVTLQLTSSRDLMVKRPYPNKRYAVACRKKGNKAMDGILFEAPSKTKELVYTANWNVDGLGIVKHRVRYQVLDQDYDAASDDMTLWYGLHGSVWESRIPTGWGTFLPCNQEPKMEIQNPSTQAAKTTDFYDGKWIVRREQVFGMPTLERERLLDGPHLNKRIPPVEDVFKG